MVLDIKEIKDIRKKLGLTQAQLSKRAGVSQSLIAKVEAGRLDPTYSNAVKLFNAINEFEKKTEIKAEEIITPKLITVTPDSTIKGTINKMKKFEISQLPVIQDNKAIGSISESNILDALIENKGELVQDIMGSPPPVVSHDTSVSIVSHLLKFFPMVLVSKKGKMLGVSTKADLLSKMYH